MAALATRQLQRTVAAMPVPRRIAQGAILAPTKRGYATPSGPPPSGFRLKQTPTGDNEHESTLDRMGKYFLMTEMARGMWVLIEQFFRPPSVIEALISRGRGSLFVTGTRYTIPSRR